MKNIIDTYKAYHAGHKLDIRIVFRWPKEESCGRKASGYLLAFRKIATDFNCTMDTIPVEDPKLYNPKDEVQRVYAVVIKPIKWSKTK